MNDAYKERNEKRPLYAAIRKYGGNKFIIEEIEQCSDKIVNEREIYWIEQYQSFKNGYNATIGGDGTHYIDYDLVVETYNHVHDMEKTANLCKCHRDSVKRILKERNIEIYPMKEVIQNIYGTKVSQYTLDGQYVKTFSSYHMAAEELIQSGAAKGAERGVSSHIRDAALGRRKTAYKFKWSLS